MLSRILAALIACTAFAVDAQTGRQLWKTRVDEHVVARITGGVKYYDGRVFVPLSGSEEFVSGNANYPCCTARGGVVALNANTGAVIWKAYNVDDKHLVMGIYFTSFVTQ